MPGLENFFSARADERGLHIEAGMLKENLEPLGHCRFIVYRENAFLAFEAHDIKV